MPPHVCGCAPSRRGSHPTQSRRAQREKRRCTPARTECLTEPGAPRGEGYFTLGLFVPVKDRIDRRSGCRRVVEVLRIAAIVCVAEVIFWDGRPGGLHFPGRSSCEEDKRRLEALLVYRRRGWRSVAAALVLIEAECERRFCGKPARRCVQDREIGGTCPREECLAGPSAARARQAFLHRLRVVVPVPSVVDDGAPTIRR